MHHAMTFDTLYVQKYEISDFSVFRGIKLNDFFDQFFPCNFYSNFKKLIPICKTYQIKKSLKHKNVHI